MVCRHLIESSPFLISVLPIVDAMQVLRFQGVLNQPFSKSKVAL